MLIIAQETQISKSTIYQWVKEYHSEKGSRPRNYHHLLEKKYERLARIIQILQNAPCTATAPLHERLRAIELMSKEYNINNLCFALKVAKGTYKTRKPQDGLLFHSDNGSNYISKAFTSYLRKFGVVQSYSKKKTPYDNSVCESYFGTMKMEELYRCKYRSEKELRKGIADYIEFYNSKRPHSVLRYMTPDKFEEVYNKMHPNEEVQ